YNADSLYRSETRSLTLSLLSHSPTHDRQGEAKEKKGSPPLARPTQTQTHTHPFPAAAAPLPGQVGGLAKAEGVGEWVIVSSPSICLPPKLSLCAGRSGFHLPRTGYGGSLYHPISTCYLWLTPSYRPVGAADRCHVDRGKISLSSIHDPIHHIHIYSYTDGYPTTPSDAPILEPFIAILPPSHAIAVKLHVRPTHLIIIMPLTPNKAEIPNPILASPSPNPTDPCSVGHVS
ncbi:hypothetical protein L249_2966, partial [Ophiocordyceps polyrhachis-furcata BCC 54312]